MRGVLFPFSLTSSAGVECQAQRLRCFAVATKFPDFSHSVWHRVTSSRVVLMQTLHTLTNRGVLILALPSLAQTTIMRLLSHTQTHAVTHTLLGLAVALSHRGIKGLGKQ